MREHSAIEPSCLSGRQPLRRSTDVVTACVLVVALSRVSDHPSLGLGRRPLLEVDLGVYERIRVVDLLGLDQLGARLWRPAS